MQGHSATYRLTRSGSATLRTSLLPLLLGLAVAACGGGGASNSTSTGTTAPSGESSPVATGPATADASASAVAGGSVNANTASVDELAAAFAAAGITNPDRWAREVAEYRPYEANPSWARLRQELGKYNIDPAVLEQILAILAV